MESTGRMEGENMSEETVVDNEQQLDTDSQAVLAKHAVMLVPFSGVIRSEADADRLGAEANELQKVMRQHKKRWDEACSKKKAEHTRMCDRRTAFLAKFLDAIDSRTQSVLKYKQEEEEKRRKAQQEAEEAAKQAAIAQALADEDEKLAEKIEKGKVAVPAPELPPDTPVKVSGMVYTKVKKGKVTDMKAFVSACLKGSNVHLGMLSVDQKKLNDWVKATDGMIQVAGIEVYEETDFRPTGR